MVKKLIIFGTGQLAEEITNYFEKDTSYKVEGFTIDEKFITKKKFLSRPVIPFNKIKKKFSPKEFKFFVAVGYTDLNQLRFKKLGEIKKKGYKLASYVSSKASIIGGQNVGENCMILENTTIQTTAKIGNNVFIWSNNLIGHHVKIEDNTYIAGNCVIAGSSVLGKFSFMGVNSTIAHGVKVGRNCLVGANTFINENISPQSASISENSKIFKIKNLEILKKMIR